MELANSLEGKVAIVTGASRGVGKAIAKRLAEAGMKVAVAAKTVHPHPTLPGTIIDTAREIEALGGTALPIATDVRDADAILHLVEETVRQFSRLDVVIHNAGAIWWNSVEETPPKRLDLVWQVNCRAAFLLAHFSIPYLKRQKGGHILVLSPPIDYQLLPHKVAYCISKFGMTMLAMGLAEEVRDDGIAVHALWPATLIDSQATRHFRMGEPKDWRKPEILADAVYYLLLRGVDETSGQVVIDEDILREAGIEDFSQYNCVPEGNPMRIVGVNWQVPSTPQKQSKEK